MRGDCPGSSSDPGTLACDVCDSAGVGGYLVLSEAEGDRVLAKVEVFCKVQISQAQYASLFHQFFASGTVIVLQQFCQHG